MDVIDETNDRVQKEMEYAVEKIREALNLGDKVHSECVICGDPIPEARLKAMPGTKYCVRCKRKMERS